MGGLVFSFNYVDYQYGVAWAAIFLTLSVISLILGFLSEVERKAMVILSVLAGLSVLFICLLISFAYAIFAGVIIAVISLLVIIGMLPIYYLVSEGNIPKKVIIMVSIIIGGIVIASAVVAFILKIASNFAIYSFVVGFIYIVIFIIATVIAIQKELNRYNHPHVYCSYGDPIYRFESDN